MRHTYSMYKFMILRTPGYATQYLQRKIASETLLQQRALNENCEYHLLDGILQVSTCYLLQYVHSHILPTGARRIVRYSKPGKSLIKHQVYLTCIKLEGRTVYLVCACYFATYTTLSIVPSFQALRTG